MEREKFSSRLGFILISAGCAIGLGNVWRFPYITGKYGGAVFILLYIVCILALGLPIVIMEFAVGRGSQKSAALSFDVLEQKGQKWHLYKYVIIAGNYLMISCYLTILSWMLRYFKEFLTGEIFAYEDSNAAFGAAISEPVAGYIYAVILVLISFGICSLGLKKGVEAITKKLMVCLFVVMIVLVINSCSLSGVSEGLKFYLAPDFSVFQKYSFFEIFFAALGQAFFTLSIGIGALAIYGSYIGKERRLTGEGLTVVGLDTLVAFMAGLIIFPACFTYNIEPDAGINLVFVTLLDVFKNMVGGRVWGSLFFLFMLCAGISTSVAVCQNIVSMTCDLSNISTKKSAIINTIILALIITFPVFGFNIWSNLQFPASMGGGDICSGEDYIVSNILLPIGGLFYAVFCCSKKGWGYNNFIKEIDSGEGIRYPKWAEVYTKYILPLGIIFVLVAGFIA